MMPTLVWKTVAFILLISNQTYVSFAYELAHFSRNWNTYLLEQLLSNAKCCDLGCWSSPSTEKGWQLKNLDIQRKKAIVQKIDFLCILNESIEHFYCLFSVLEHFFVAVIPYVCLWVIYVNTCENFHIFFWCSPLFSVIIFFFIPVYSHTIDFPIVFGVTSKLSEDGPYIISEKQVVYSLRRIVSRHRPTRRHTYLICEDTRSSDAQISTWRKRDDCLQLQNFSVAVARDMVRLELSTVRVVVFVIAMVI